MLPQTAVVPALLGLLLAWLPVRADGPADNIPDKVRRIPKLGIEVPAEKRTRLHAELDALADTIAGLRRSKDIRQAALLPDVQIYYQAVHDALKYQEFFSDKEIDVAFELLAEGRARAEQLTKGQALWATATGLVVRGYVSKIDGSVQPYGLVVPTSYTPSGSSRYCLDLWFHGRGETLSEVNFLNDRRKNAGTFAPPDTFVLHPYGRYSNANKFAGEMDVLEALASVQQRYRIDEDRISVRGFSMGGASTWQFAVHYPGRWAAANPGAGFAETPEFLKSFQKETLQPPWYEQKLWRWYDCTDWAGNLFHCPTVAYSGEKDIQKQAADIMQQALAKEGIELVHVIGPGMGHSYHPQSRAEVDRVVSGIVHKGRERLPRTIHFTTYTLRYNQVGWITLDGLGEHWERAHVDGQLINYNQVSVRTRNVTALTLSIPPGYSPFDSTRPMTLTVDGEQLPAPRPRSDRSWFVQLNRRDGKWRIGAPPADGLRKQPGLQGPIDDAFMDGFVFVRPTGKCKSDKVDAWVHAELDRAIEHWRRHFRGHPRIKDDKDVTDTDIANFNLVLWGDPAANRLLDRIDEGLPLHWGGGEVSAGSQRFPAEDHVPILIYPNPLNPRRYVVVNSSFTFRDFAYLNNARQTPKLPDWAIVDVNTAPNALWPGKVVAADFFDENWRLKSPRP